MTQQIQKGEHSSWWSNIGSAHMRVPENEIISPGVTEIMGGCGQ